MQDDNIAVSAEDQIREVRRVTWAGLGINLALSAVKFAAGFWGGSQAVIADAAHSLSDMSTDIAVLFGVKFWNAPPDRRHPYGHRRIEALVTAFIGLALVLVAVEIAKHAIDTMRTPDLRPPHWIAMAAAAISMVSKEWLYRWTRRTGERMQSTAVIANAWHHRSDALSSIPALVAVGLALWNPAWAFMDHIGALVVSIFILKVAWDILRPSLGELIDRGGSERDIARIREVALAVPQVRSVHALRTRRMGHGLYVDLHIQVDGALSVREGHAIAGHVKHHLRADGPSVIDVVVHLEPDEKA